ncbi:cysteine rich repeat-containing protein [Methylosinus sp. H3A]|nr:cysteine rich repeat-containing protein [Methylosinus sp. H3A]
MAAILAAAIAAEPAVAQTAPSGDRADVAKKACKGDYQRLCSGVMPGGGRILACLQNHSSELGPDCAKALGK